MGSSVQEAGGIVAAWQDAGTIGARSCACCPGVGRGVAKACLDSRCRSHSMMADAGLLSLGRVHGDRCTSLARTTVCQCLLTTLVHNRTGCTINSGVARSSVQFQIWGACGAACAKLPVWCCPDAATIQGLSLALSCLSFDFVGSCADDSSEDMTTIQVQ